MRSKEYWEALTHLPLTLNGGGPEWLFPGLIPPAFCIFGCLGHISLGRSGPPDGQRVNWGSDSEFWVLHLSTCSLPTFLQPPHAGLLATPHPQPPVPTDRCLSSPGQLSSWWLCMSLCDLGQMVPVNISCHSAMTGSSLTHVCVRQKRGLILWHPTSVPILCPISPRGSTPPHQCHQHSTHLCPQTSPRGRPLCVLAEKLKAHGKFLAPSRLWGFNKG